MHQDVCKMSPRCFKIPPRCLQDAQSEPTWSYVHFLPNPKNLNNILFVIDFLKIFAKELTCFTDGSKRLPRPSQNPADAPKSPTKEAQEDIYRVSDADILGFLGTLTPKLALSFRRLSSFIRVAVSPPPVVHQIRKITP